MSNPRLPPEILDHIIDLLHANPETLKQCCLVSKSLIPRTRKHLFSNIKFDVGSPLEAWKKNFPDPANSPAYCTHSLAIGWGYLMSVTVVDAEEGGWIRTFANVVQLELGTPPRYWRGEVATLVPFHSFSSSLKSLRLVFVPAKLSQCFKLICSLPLLEDLTIAHDDYDISCDEDMSNFRPSVSPVLTGTLYLCELLEYTVPLLLDLPGGPHFREIVYKSERLEDARWMTALMERCRDTLESVDITLLSFSGLPLVPLDFSNTTKLREVTFRFSTGVTWVPASLRTITSNHKDLRRITVRTFFPYPSWKEMSFGNGFDREWVDLDLILVQLWELLGVRTGAIYKEYREKRKGKQSTREIIEAIFPEMTKRGLLELVNSAEDPPQ